MAGILAEIGSVGSAVGGALGGIGSAAASAGPALGGATTLASTAAPAMGGLGAASGAAGAAGAASAVPMMGAIGPSMSGLATMGSQGPVQGGSLGQTVGQMQAGPMRLGPANSMQTGRTAGSAVQQMMGPGGDAARSAIPANPQSGSAQSWWSQAGKWIQNNPEALQMAGQLGTPRVENPPPQIGPMRYNNAAIQSGVNLGQMGLARLAQSYGRR